MHALVDPGVAGAYGVEIDRIKCDKAAAFVRQTDAALTARKAINRLLPLPAVQHAAVEQVGTRLDPRIPQDACTAFFLLT